MLIEEGKVLDHNMKKMKFSLDDLNQLLREKDVFDITQVEYALLEVSGELSVLKKEPFQPTTRSDFQLPSSPISLPVEVIMEGELVSKNLTGDYSKEWVLSQCQMRNVSLKDIYYAVINSKGNLFIDKYDDGLTRPTDVE